MKTVVIFKVWKRSYVFAAEIVRSLRRESDVVICIGGNTTQNTTPYPTLSGNNGGYAMKTEGARSQERRDALYGTEGIKREVDRRVWSEYKLRLWIDPVMAQWQLDALEVLMGKYAEPTLCFSKFRTVNGHSQLAPVADSDFVPFVITDHDFTVNMSVQQPQEVSMTIQFSQQAADKAFKGLLTTGLFDTEFEKEFD